MFSTKLPRAFVLAGLGLLFLVFGTSYYLYDDVPYSAPTDLYRGTVAGAAGGSEGGFRYDSSHGSAPDDEAYVDSDKADDFGHLFDSIAKPDAKPEPEPGSTHTHVSPVASSAVQHDQSPSKSSGLSGALQDDGDDPRPPSSTGQCIPELEFLKDSHKAQHFTDQVIFSRRCITPVFSDKVDRNEVANVSESLIGDQLVVDINECSSVKLPKCVPIKLSVPKPYPQARNYSQLIFGIATSYDRLAESLEPFAHTLTGSNVQLIAAVPDYNDHPSEDIKSLETRFRDAGVNATLYAPIDPNYTISQSHFTVLVHMVERSGPETKWFGLLDDDTFFPNLKPLSDALATLDHTEDMYVGTLSEDFGAIRNFGYMAFGGAGAFLSAPLARKLAPMYAKCIDEATSPEGDIITRDCIYRNSRAKLTILPGLYQQDIKGDAGGFFEGGLQPINLHHWKSWYSEPVVKLSQAADYCGDCFLQRWRFGTDTVLTNGFSIARYSAGFDSIDLKAMEATWWNWNHDYDFSIGPFRERLGPDQKKSYKLEDAKITEPGVLKQLYVWRGNSTAGEFDEVVELVWSKESGTKSVKPTV